MTNEIIINLTAKDTATGKVISLTEALKALKVAGDKASKGSKGIQDAQDKLRKSTDDATTALSKLKTSIGRIAFYRAVRDAIRRVTQGLVEGTNNLVMYSAAMNSMDASRANETMSEFAKISLWVKDTLASALMPILQSLVPVVNNIAEVFVFAANAINQFIKALQGSAVWTKALKYPVDYAEKLNGVGKAAKEAKKQIFGFDELNIFNAPTNGGGGSTPALDYSSLFEEAEVTDGFANVASLIKQHLNNIELIVGDAALAAGAILMLTGHHGAGIAALIAGAELKWGSAGVNWDSLGTTVQGRLNNLILKEYPVMMAIGAILALTGHYASGIGLMAASVGMFSFAAANDELTDQLRNDVKQKLEDVGAVASLVPLAMGLILAFTDPTKFGVALGLIATGAVGLGTAIAMDNGLLKGSITDNLRVVADAAALMHLAIGSILLFIPGKQLLGAALVGMGAIERFTAGNLEASGISEEITKKLTLVENVILGFQVVIGALLILSGNPALIPKGIGLIVSAAAIKLGTTDFSSENTRKWFSDRFGGLNSDIKDNFGNAADNSVEEFKSRWQGKYEGVKQWFSKFDLRIPVKTDVQYPNVPGVASRATGGFVDSGQMFMARENGIPEMVGSIGNQTAVANNGQIIEGIAAGVANAMTNTNSAIYQMANAVVDAIANKEINTTVISDRDIYQSAQRGKTLSGRTVYA